MPYLTPPSTPVDNFCRSILIPDEPIWVGTFTGALYPLTFDYNWEQSEGGITPVDAAEKARQIFYQYLESSCGSIAGRVYRPRSTSAGGFGYEYTEDGGGTWVEDNPLPPRPERTEPTDDEKKCLGARNAAEVYNQFWLEMIELYEDGVAPALALASGIAGALLGLFYPPALLFVQPIFAGIFGVFEFLTINDWDAQITEDLTCILLSHATVNEDDTITFDFESVNNEIGGKILEGRVWLTISYFMNMLGADALNRAGSTTSIETYACTPCLSWCYEYDFTINQGGFTAISPGGIARASYAANTGWTRVYNVGGLNNSEVRITQIYPFAVNIKRVELDYTANATFQLNMLNFAIDAGTQPSGTNTVSIEQNVTTTNLRLDMYKPGGNFTLTARKFRIYGDGANPIGTDNC